ncbi:hypothetical protein Pth03_45510 [Planotetraspora thailandica]|uniref:Glycosyltransferase RgtA/B/C/D-like domain-containing protein n=1 Tax=Planotetraspora thailandica TaxID=487172 RepID=A0A8J3V2I7_9ACTN|nr:hypothetical protein [Planotetraspora thailandica]GII56162.1 hypothetical protein Pth03_45510 [Planotetraspora thailandica]
MRLVRRHWLFAGVLTLAVAVRAVTMIGYPQPVWFEDSFDYVGVAERMQPYPIRPSGYSFVLWLTRPLHSFAAVTALQHLMGLAMGVMLYLLIRRRAPRLAKPWAVLVVCPVLLDGYQIFFEHTILSDVLFSFLVTTATTITLWTPRISLVRAALAALFIAAAVLTRSTGLVLLPLLAGYLLINRAGWRALGAASAVAALCLGGYALWYDAWHGSPALNGGSGVWLWARTMPIADCTRTVPRADEAILCPSGPREGRPSSPAFIWSPWSPLRKIPGHAITMRPDLFHPQIDDLAGRFARRVILSQPLDYLGLVAKDAARTLAWGRGPDPGPIFYNRYAFPNAAGPLPDGVRIAGGTIQHDLRAYEQGAVAIRFDEPMAGIMRGYLSYVYLPGTVFGLLLGYTAVRAVRRRGETGKAVALPLAFAVALVIAPVVVAAYDSRYWLPAVPLLGMAAAISFADRLPVRPLVRPAVRVDASMS